MATASLEHFQGRYRFSNHAKFCPSTVILLKFVEDDRLGAARRSMPYMGAPRQRRRSPSPASCSAGSDGATTSLQQRQECRGMQGTSMMRCTPTTASLLTLWYNSQEYSKSVYRYSRWIIQNCDAMK